MNCEYIDWLRLWWQPIHRAQNGAKNVNQYIGIASLGVVCCVVFWELSKTNAHQMWYMVSGTFALWFVSQDTQMKSGGL